MVACADDVCPHGRRRGRHHDVEGRCDAMLARWSTPFCSGDGRQAGLLYFAAGYRDTTHGSGDGFDQFVLHMEQVR